MAFCQLDVMYPEKSLAAQGVMKYANRYRKRVKEMSLRTYRVAFVGFSVLDG